MRTFTEQEVIKLLNFLIYDIESGQFNHKNEEVFFKLTGKEWLMWHEHKKEYTEEEVIELIKKALNADFYYIDLVNDGDDHWNNMGAVINESLFKDWCRNNLNKQ